MVAAMTCPVCGLLESGSPCARCGTDLKALDGAAGKAQLEIVAVHRTDRAKGPGRPAH